MLSKSLGVVHIIDMISISDACLVVTNPKMDGRVNFTVLVYSMLDWPISLFVDPRLNRESEVPFSARIYPKSRLID